MKKDLRRSRMGLRGKLVILVSCVGIFFCILTVQMHDRTAKNQSRESLGKEEERSENDRKKAGDGAGSETGSGEDQGKADGGGDKPKADGGKAEDESIQLNKDVFTVDITNLEEALCVMDKNIVLLEERLNDWAAEKNVKGSSAEIFHVMVPQSDPQSIQFYLKLDDKKQSLVMLAYHPRENVVTASSCQYSEEEIIQEVWEDNGPDIRDAKEAEGEGGDPSVRIEK